MITIVLALALLVSPTAALAAQNTPSTSGFLSANKLWLMCSEDTSGAAPTAVYSNGYCLGYIAGVADGLAALGRGCAPPGLTEGQLHDVVIAYLRDNPAERDYSAASTIGAAMEHAWCRRKGTK
jgi:hypothetical protein